MPPAYAAYARWLPSSFGSFFWRRVTGRWLFSKTLRSFVAPGQSLSLSAKLLHEGSGYAVTKADIRCDGKLTCNAEITFRLVEFPNAEFRASMEKMAAILEFPMGTLAHG